ncbi:rubrerythrin [Waterburya agarophytonicola K14]|uniref:Rubrerythrin n=1 Tax=Waterburya agarophytonicola KI4 TaxID=2874699 RepID=A0A964BQ59_9CYAN|nr:rubrerythrin family protein [Waterburya agarophytonicola]MCC0175880.1 rubrerythrin [Waterburya agarophytonicola KI4]
MTRYSNFGLTLKKAGKWSIVTSLAALTLVGCSQAQPPEARVESSKPAQATLVSAKQNSQSLENLQKAYNGESNAHVMYLAFADKAESEGYQDVANLFKAVARAEEIHRDNHAEVIKAMGATPENKITTPQVNSTADNLEKAVGGNLSNAIKGESYERDSMYPEFIEQAQAENNSAALKTFELALAAETQHADLFSKVNQDLDNRREASNSYFVCTISGETFDRQPEAEACPQNPNGESLEQVI